MKTIYNNQSLDDMVPGFTTVNVEGRGILPRRISPIDVQGRDGAKVIDQSLPIRELTVHYRMLAKNSVEYLEQINILHDYLHTKEDVVVEFTDEMHYRMGRLSSTEAPPYDFYRGFGSFTVLCQDPYKYRDLSPATGSSLSRFTDSQHNFKINSITATVATNRTGFEITNIATGRKIILTGALTAGQKIVMKPDDGILTINGQNAMNRLDFIASDWHDFKIYSRNQITASQAITLDLSERAL